MKTRVKLNLNFTRPHAITYTYTEVYDFLQTLYLFHKITGIYAKTIIHLAKY